METWRTPKEYQQMCCEKYLFWFFTFFELSKRG